MNGVKAQILKYPNDWRCDAGHGFDKPGGSGKTGRRYFKDDDGSDWHEVQLRPLQRRPRDEHDAEDLYP